MLEFATDRELSLMASGMTPGFAAAPVQFTHGKGCLLFDSNGNEYIDFCSGTFTNAYGHAHPRAIAFMRERLGEMWNIHDYSSPFRLPLLEKLNEMTPKHIDRFQFYTGGSETVEAGLRALYSYLPAGKKCIAAFSGAYHGKTLGSRQLFKWQFPGEAPGASVQLPFPDFFGLLSEEKPEHESQCIEQIESIFAAHNDLGAVIFEPIQGAGGNLAASQWFWDRFSELCQKHQILMFADEICVGFGRVGYDFAFQKYGLKPDLIAFAKGIGGGFPTMCLAGRSDIINARPFGDLGGASTTFGGNPLSIAAMHVSLDIYQQEQLARKARLLAPTLAEFVARLKSKYVPIFDARSTGLMATLCLKNGDTEQSKAFAISLHQKCLQLGLKVMTFDQLFRIAPPLNISEEMLIGGMERLERAFSQTVHHCEAPA